MYRSEYIVCFRSEISFVPLLFSHRTPFLRPYWQIYFNSTSNHNFTGLRVSDYGVVSYFNSTSNHNLFTSVSRRVSLFLISILHQTTTVSDEYLQHVRLFLISILHQTTTFSDVLVYDVALFLISILHQTTTVGRMLSAVAELFLISILHQTTTRRTFNSYATPLFLISILHQTTTSDMRFVDCHSVMWPNERYERRMTGRGSRNDAGFVFQRYFSLKVECTSCARNRYMFAK